MATTNKAARPTGRRIGVDDLWKLERLGAPSLAPDGAQAVCSLTRHSMEDNKSATSLLLVSTLGGRPRTLTTAGDKDGQPQWAPSGELIAFVAKREQQGAKDEVPQLYLIAPDGGEARRAGSVATGVEAFRWLPDRRARRIAFVSWVWPALKGAKAQAKQAAAWKDRKETGYATSESQYRYWDRNLPQDRVPHLHLMELKGDRVPPKVTDLFEGTPYELARTEPDASGFDVSPDGRRIAFAYDPAPDKRAGNRYALAEVDLATGRIATLVLDDAWDCGAPRYAPDGDRIAFVASHQGVKHTMPGQLAVWERESGRWDVVSAEWDHEVQAPLKWEDDGLAVLLRAEQKGRTHLWRFDVPDRRAEVVVEGGTITAFDKAAGILVTLADASDHPGRLHARLPGEAPRRLENCNDALLAGLALGRTEELWIRGASAVEGGPGDEVQVWLTYPPGFDGRRETPLLHLIHGGPHTAFGDQWHYRWNSHVFAAAGHVVAAVNYHGSSGFGYAFLDSITHRWGALELQDVEAATDELLKRPWADPARVYASGGSYGGYMVAWMNGHVPAGRYAAYVCHAGCFDWTGMFADDAWAWHAKELGAWYWDDPAKVDAQSPHAFAGAMSTPTLVVHGALDYRVPDAQGLAYYNTLRALKVDARLLWFPDENHWVLKPRNSRQWYAEFLDWLARHPRPVAAAKPKRTARALR